MMLIIMICKLAWMEEIRSRLPTGARFSIVSRHEDLKGKPFLSQVYVVTVRRANWFSSRHVKVTEAFCQSRKPRY